jgi:hypothetical protein
MLVIACGAKPAPLDVAAMGATAVDAPAAGVTATSGRKPT